MGDEPRVGPCPSEDSLAAYFGRAGALDDGPPSTLEHHLANCRSCRSLVAALARASDPPSRSAVVSVHDVGVTDGNRVWLAMELVRGQTLDTWLRARRRPWTMVLSLMIQAGRGLRAVHAAGLLHRDFKPANMMVESSGDGERARIMDFGLVRATVSPERRAESPITVDDVADASVTGTLIGTPAYMAPEQLRGETASERSDQFSFCVTAWEALYGVRPFAGQTVAELAAALERDRPTAAAGAAVPGWLRRVLERGMTIDPRARWPGMNEVLEALQRGRTQARWRRGLAVAALVGLVPAAIAGWNEFDGKRRTAACEQAGESITEAWNDEARAALRDGLLATNVGYARETADRVMPWLDDYAAAWQTARTETCIAADVHETWDEDARERGLWCLDERRMELDALVAELSRAEASAVEKAVQGAAQLGDVAPCRDVEWLRRLPSPPADHRDEVRAVSAELSRAMTLERTGAYERGLATALEVLVRAEALEWPPLVAQARFVAGALHSRRGDFAKAEQVLELAYFEAARAGSPEVAWAAAEGLVRTVGVDLTRHDDGVRWSRLAEVVLTTLPDPAELRRAKHLLHLSGVHEVMGAYDDAKVLGERALNLYETALGAHHPMVAVSLINLAAIAMRLGELKAAQASQERALAIFQNAFGPGHPEIAVSLSNLAIVHHSSGRHGQAKTLYERALAIMHNALGPEHLSVANTLSNLALVHEVMEEDEQAMVLLERALAIRRKAVGPEHPLVATNHHNIAFIYDSMGKYAEAKGHYERALAIYEKTLGPEHVDSVMSLASLAAVDFQTGAYERARTRWERALALYEKLLGMDHPKRALCLQGLAEVALAQRRFTDAVMHAEGTLAQLQRSESSALHVADALFLLARALWLAHRDRARAIDLAERAREIYRNSERPDANLAEVEAWLEAHARSR